MAINDNVRIKTAFANPASIGSNLVIAGLPYQKIRVLGVAMLSASVNTISFLSNTTDISADMPLSANGGFVLPFTSSGWFETNTGESLNVDLSASAQVGLSVLYEVYTSV